MALRLLAARPMGLVWILSVLSFAAGAVYIFALRTAGITWWSHPIAWWGAAIVWPVICFACLLPLARWRAAILSSLLAGIAAFAGGALGLFLHLVVFGTGD
jgi:hypothetical protein